MAVRSISEISSCFLGPRSWHIEIRHRVKKTSTINLFGFETLKLKIRRLKLWKPAAPGGPRVGDLRREVEHRRRPHRPLHTAPSSARFESKENDEVRIGA